MRRTRSRTYHAGARDERREWLAMLRRRRRGEVDPERQAALDELIEYGQARVARYEKRPGGLGRE